MGLLLSITNFIVFEYPIIDILTLCQENTKKNNEVNCNKKKTPLSFSSIIKLVFKQPRQKGHKLLFIYYHNNNSFFPLTFTDELGYRKRKVLIVNMAYFFYFKIAGTKANRGIETYPFKSIENDMNCKQKEIRRKCLESLR